ncbi:MAG: response regulator [Gemmatimonadales bacterium]|nr:response regulator [Gemmatimonadales bacterium]
MQEASPVPGGTRPTPLPAKPAAKRVVLVVDDDPDMQRWAAAILQQAGFRVVPALDGMTALSLARSSKPNVMLLDLGLPAGGGKLVLERLRRIAPLRALPVLVLSARITPDTAAELAPFGVTTLLEKPIEPARLVEAVNEALAPPT